MIGVGGWRTPALMNKHIGRTCDALAISRPLLNDPTVVNKWIEDPDHLTECISCNKYFATAAYQELPPDMHTRPLLNDQFVSIVRPGHPCLERRMTLRRFAALQHILVAPGGRPGGVVDAMLQEQGLKRRVVRTLSSFLPAPFLVARSDYVLTLPISVAQVAGKLVKFKILDMPKSPPGYTLRLVWHERMHHDPAHKWFRDLVARQLKGLNAKINRRQK